MTQNPSELLQQVIETRAHANLDLGEVPHAVRSGHESRKRQAEIELPGLLNRLKAETIPKRLIGVFASGDPKAVADVADFLTKNDGIVIEADRLYRETADKIEPTYSGLREFTSNQLMGVTLKCEELGSAVGIRTVNLDFIEAYCRTYEESLDHCRRIVRTSVGDKLNLALLSQKVVDVMLAQQLDDPLLPVIVTGATADEIPALRALFSKSVVHTFEATEKPLDREGLIAVLKTAQ